MKRELALEFARVTEAAALAAHKWVGRGKKESADQAGVDAMRTMLNRLAIDGEIVIGEGEIDEAPMLYIGEKVGLIYNEEEKDSVTYVDPVDIAVDPVEGTRMTAQGQPNAITVLAVGKKGSFLKAPDMYMEKIIVGPEAKGQIDLSKPLEDNIHAVAKALNKELKDLMYELYENEAKYTDEIYGDIGLTGDVKEYIRYNANKALMNLGFEEEFEIKNVNPIVLNGLNVETTQHDFFSKKSTNYEKALEVVHLHDDDFKFDDELDLDI